MLRVWVRIIILLSLQVSSFAFAQMSNTSENTSTDKIGEDLGEKSEADSTDSEVEDLYDKFDTNESTKKEEEKKEIKKSKEKEAENQKQKSDPKSLSDLSTLAPLNDVAIIQKRFLPKTKRFELSASALGTINNPFFLNVGAGLRVGYYFQEKYGVELTYLFLSSSERSVTEGLRTKRNVRTESLVTPKSYLGADFKWTPMYGKTTFINKRIVPFDFYFLLGLGTTTTENNGNAPTFHLGGGQSFALSKRMAFRWDLGWSFYQAKSQIVSSGVSKEISSNHDDLYIGMGMSFFFPEATYR